MKQNLSSPIQEINIPKFDLSCTTVLLPYILL